MKPLLPTSPPSVASSAIPIRPSNGKTFGPMEVIGVGSFGEVLAVAPKPELQIDFVYGGHPDLIVEEVAGTGSIDYADTMAAVHTGASLGGSALLRSDRAIRYRPGQGVLMRFTTLFSAPVFGVYQHGGAFAGGENALFFGYDHEDAATRFGCCIRSGGVRTIHSFEVDVAASGAETLTLTLDGDAVAVSLTAGTLQENAKEIAETSFPGWTVEADDMHVHFLSDTVGPRAGAYTDSSTGTADGTWSENVAGALPTDEWEYQENWSHDKFNGTGPSGINLDFTKGNVYQIRFQFLGYGPVDFDVEDPTTGQYVTAHRFQRGNTREKPTVSNPTFHMGIACGNTDAASDLQVRMASMAGFVEGLKLVEGPDHGTDIEGAASAATPVLSVRNSEIFIDGISRANLRDVLPTLLSVAGSGSNKPIKVQALLNGTLTDPLWIDYAADHSLTAIDVFATGITGGDVIFTTSFPSGGDRAFNLLALDIILRPGDIVSLVVTPTGTPVDYTASLAWKEDV